MNFLLEDRVYETHEILSKQIIINNQIFKAPRGILGRFSKIFETLDFGLLHVDLKKLANNLEEIRIEILKFAESELNDQEITFSSILIDFIIPLKDTIDCLEQICLKLEQKGKNVSYPISQYRIDVKKYRNLVNIHASKGTDLNTAFRNFRD